MSLLVDRPPLERRRRGDPITRCACASCVAARAERAPLRTPSARYIFAWISDDRRFCRRCGVRFKNPNRSIVCAVCLAKERKSDHA